MKASDFPPGTKFFEVDDIPIAFLPMSKPLGHFSPDGSASPVSENTARKLAYEAEISSEEFDLWVDRAIASFAENK